MCSIFGLFQWSYRPVSQSSTKWNTCKIVVLTFLFAITAVIILMLTMVIFITRSRSGRLQFPEEVLFDGVECDRPCQEGDVRTCIFNWEVQYYYSMLTGPGRPCGNCPFTPEDCNKEICVTLNGIQRTVIAVNRQVPGPKIIVCLNDTLIVNVKNSMEDMSDVTIHWHGLTQFHSPAMDGPSMITQCPIPFATTFTYKFVADRSGTHFWHAHLGTLRGDGLAGPLVVREQNDVHKELYDIDDTDSHILFLQDWLNNMHILNFSNYLYNHGKNWADFILINGKDEGPPITDGTTTGYVPRVILNVTENMKYRIRVISNALTGCQMEVSIDGHPLLAVFLDGSAIDPTPMDAFVLNSGERLDFILHANRTPGNYWLRVTGVGNNCVGRLQARAIVRYVGEGNSEPNSTYKKPGNVLNVPVNLNKDGIYANTRTLTSLTTVKQFEGAIGEPLRTYYLSLGVNKVENSDQLITHPLPQINYISYQFPSVPLLTQHNEVNQSLFCDATDTLHWKSCRKSQCSCTHVLHIDLWENVELFFYNINDNDQTDAACHPMHLHGFRFRVVGMGRMIDGITHEELYQLDLSKDTPFRRTDSRIALYKDSVCISHNSYMIVQFVADNPGWWLIHCHLDYHASLGMQMVLHVGSDEDVKDYIPDNVSRCGNFQPR